ncbi:hypothetical protein [Neorhodopirellula pilleata]|uniref:Uncharacterized protein n=1 Tax=Neorhodopirellula pilleata TaxID=2714738 RepID=A0A5C6A4P9_9BACT|nr:hypothetical protein [Neorhodopirellula pilleata]TWT94365.1 hypothetical protein Pla100_39770 [Neorhodopirellula pilleata]
MKVCNFEPKNESRNSVTSRSAMRRRLRRRNRRVEKLQSRNDHLQQRVHELEKRLSNANSQLENAQAQLLQRSSIEQPMMDHRIECEKPLPGHQFGVTLIAAAIELARRVGFRAAADVIAILFDLLNVDMKVPSHDAIEQWTLRLGVASLQDTFTKEDRVLWMSDHSSQIGKEKVLLIIGIALDDLPISGETLCLEKMRVLAIVPGESWKKEDVEREYQKLAERIGPPVYLLCDGAVELREPAEKLGKNGQKTIVLGDLKHHAANVLEKEIGRDERFQSFMSQVGLTRNRVQQTELSHFAPPPIKQKSRFMNLGSLLNWASMVLHHLDDPGSDSRTGVSDQRMEEKLGWLRDFADDVANWNQCQVVIDRSLEVINREGLAHETAEVVRCSLTNHDANWNRGSSSASRIGLQLIQWIGDSSSRLNAGERAWLSTEILESLFGRFKQLERQHSKGGFTRLIAALPTLCVRLSDEAVRRGFARVHSPQLSKWITIKSTARQLLIVGLTCESLAVLGH